MYQSSRQSIGSDTQSLLDEVEFGSFENADDSGFEKENDPPVDAQAKKSDHEKAADKNLTTFVNAKPSATAAAAVEFGSSYDNPINLDDSDFEKENDPPLDAQAKKSDHEKVADNNLTTLANAKPSVDVSALEILPPDQWKRNSRSRLLCKVAGCNIEGRKNKDNMCVQCSQATVLKLAKQLQIAIKQRRDEH